MQPQYQPQQRFQRNSPPPSPNSSPAHPHVHNPYGHPGMAPGYPPQHGPGVPLAMPQGYYPSPGSLGTPHIGGPWHSPTNQGGPLPRRPSQGNSPSNASGGPMGGAPMGTGVIIPTRPVLKALAKECRPSPPWCVGFPVPQTMSEELMRFYNFVSQSPSESQRSANVLGVISEVCASKLWEGCSIEPMSTSAAGIIPPDSVLHYYVDKFEFTEDNTKPEEEIRSAFNDVGFQADFFKDYRGMPSIKLTEARTGDRCTLRYGPQAHETKKTAEVLTAGFNKSISRRYAFVVIDAVLRQNRALEDWGVSSALLPCEAIAIMLLAIANSYEDSDVPDAERLVNDFFLTFGYDAHFDIVAHSVSIDGMANQIPKVHKAALLSVLDPSDPTRNLTSNVEKIAHIRGVFQYCYTAISQFSQASSANRRAQSALSTIIGGEAYWTRVLHHYKEQTEPFYSAVLERRGALIQN
jgi:hypothetical protein